MTETQPTHPEPGSGRSACTPRRRSRWATSSARHLPSAALRGVRADDVPARAHRVDRRRPAVHLRLARARGTRGHASEDRRALRVPARELRRRVRVRVRLGEPLGDCRRSSRPSRACSRALLLPGHGLAATRAVRRRRRRDPVPHVRELARREGGTHAEPAHDAQGDRHPRLCVAAFTIPATHPASRSPRARWSPRRPRSRS